MILISGSNGSGKSAFAESLVARTEGDRYYIATMMAQTEENLRRIEKHRRQRENLNFTTLELSHRVAEAPVTEGSVVLLEDVTNLLGNAIFVHGEEPGQVFADILALAEKCALLIAVTISGLSAEGYDGETAAYIRDTEELNRKLYDASEAAAELREGVPQWQKGEGYVECIAHRHVHL